MSSNIENVKHSNDGNNNDNLPPDGGGHGNVLGQRTNLPALATDQPYKPVTGTDGGTQDSGYRTGSTSGTAFFPASASSSGPASATLVSTTSSSAATEDSASASPSAMTTRGRHARHEAQDLGRPHTGVGAAIDLARIDENQPRSSSTHAYRHYGDDHPNAEHPADNGKDPLDDIDITKSIAFTPVDTTPLRLNRYQTTACGKQGTSPVSPKISRLAQSPDDMVMEGPGPHVPKHREHDGSEAASILRGKKSLPKLDTSTSTFTPKRPTFEAVALEKPHSNTKLPLTPWLVEGKEGDRLKVKRKPMKVGMWPPIERLGVKLREKITGVDERTREAQQKARKASVDAKALHKEVSGAPAGPMSKIVHKAKSITLLARNKEHDESANGGGGESSNAADEGGRKRSKWWSDWQQKTTKNSVDLSDEDEKSLQRKSQKALHAMDKRQEPKGRSWYGIHRTADYPPRPWPVPTSSGPVGSQGHSEMFYHPDLKHGEPLEKYFYVDKFGRLTPYLKDSQGRPIKSSNHSENTSTASNWGERVETAVNNVGRTFKKVAGRQAKSEGDALDSATNERVPSWRLRADFNRSRNTAAQDAVAIRSTASPRDSGNMEGEDASAERQRQPSGIYPNPPGEADHQSLSALTFPSMPTESSTEYSQSVCTADSVVEPVSDSTQAPSAPNHGLSIAEQAQPGSGILQAPSIPNHDPAARQATAGTLMMPRAAGAHLLAVPGASSPPVRPNSTATENVPSLISDTTPSGSDSPSS